jgi:hypothetical protein
MKNAYTVQCSIFHKMPIVILVFQYKIQNDALAIIRLLIIYLSQVTIFDHYKSDVSQK